MSKRCTSVFVLILLFTLKIVSQVNENSLAQISSRLYAFGRTIPQEKVYIHMDNTCYQLGDTIWFSAYTRRTDTDKPSDVSGVLYVELYDQDGYMSERKLIHIQEGHGEGFFALNKQIMYAGFYELRAYTRWQLNWGLFEHKHTRFMSEQFISVQQEKDYYRDYRQLYSRVFPVYDKPTEPSDFNHDMTLRALRRAYNNSDNKRELNLTLFPEGGNLIEGLPCRVAFEATWDDGEWAEGYLHYLSDSVKVQHRGRGLIEITPEKGMERDLRFVTPNGESVKVKLPKVESTGVSMQLRQTETGWVARIENTADLNPDSMALSLMHEGKLVTSLQMNQLNKQGATYQLAIDESLLSDPGVYQATLFDVKGRVYSDRLFFSRGNLHQAPPISIEGIKEEYRPYEPVNLTLKTPAGKNHLSLSVKDDNHRDYLYDSGNILTEMLLSSEIQGFVPHPEWYFQADDSVHRKGLDLLMMTQGWRRFDWREIAIRGAWEIVQPAEKTPIITGCVYDNDNWFIPASQQSSDSLSWNGKGIENTDEQESSSFIMESFTGAGHRPTYISQDMIARKKAIDKLREANSHMELKIHAESIELGEKEGYISEGVTDHGKFRLELPPYYGKYVLFISVADTTKWKNLDKPYTWIQAEPYNEDTDFMFMPASRKVRNANKVEYAQHLARVCWPYPRFVKPYNYYQNHLSSYPERENMAEHKLSDGTTVMREVTIKRRRNRLRRFNDAWPIMAIDAEEAQNLEADMGLSYMMLMTNGYGLNLAKNEFEGEPTYETRYGYGQTRRQINGLNVSPDSLYARKYLKSASFLLTLPNTDIKSSKGLGSDEHFHLSPGESLEYIGTGVWDTYVLYSDYSPRMEGNSMYIADKPKTKLVQYPFADGSRRMTYRDRRYVLDGFAYPAEFYHPDYSKQKPDPEHADYRRTLYWNPNLQLDENGEATVTFYNNSRTTHLSVEAEGQAADGTLLWGKEE